MAGQNPNVASLWRLFDEAHVAAAWADNSTVLGKAAIATETLVALMLQSSGLARYNMRLIEETPERRHVRILADRPADRLRPAPRR